MQPVLAFDMNGTLTDISALDPIFADHFGTSIVRYEWFMELIQLAMVATITNCYQDFATLGQSALAAVAERHHVKLTDRGQRVILETMRTLPPHPDVKPGLTRLKQADYRLVLLTNSSGETASNTVRNAGLTTLFDEVLSVEAVQRYKPAADVYRMAADKMRVEMRDLMMVAAHAWDTTGAIRAGAQAAFIRREGQVLDPGSPQPNLIAKDINDLAEQLLQAQKAA